MGRDRLYIVLGVLLGIAIGVGGYTFVYARGYSYLTNDPAACANCHVMRDHYEGWLKSGHHPAAACNDCHTPHDLAGKYATKGLNGMFHSFAFTSGRFPDEIQITARNQRVTEGTCRSCHEELTTSIAGAHDTDDFSCIHCHANVGHAAADYAPEEELTYARP